MPHRLSALSGASLETADPSCLRAAAPRTRRKEARPGELLAAALELFVEKGYAATRVEEVAARAGVSKGTLFLYFPSKEELFKAVVRENITGPYAAWAVEIDTYEKDTVELLRYALHMWWTHVGSTQVSGMCKVKTAEARNFPELADFYENEVERPGNVLLRRILQRGIDRGEFRPLDLDYAVCMLLAPMQFLELWRHSGAAGDPHAPPFDPERFLDVMVDTLLRGFCAHPAPASRDAAT